MIVELVFLRTMSIGFTGGVAEWVRHSALNHKESALVGSNPVVRLQTTSQQPTQLSILSSSVNEQSEANFEGHKP